MLLLLTISVALAAGTWGVVGALDLPDGAADTSASSSPRGPSPAPGAASDAATDATAGKPTSAAPRKRARASTKADAEALATALADALRADADDAARRADPRHRVAGPGDVRPSAGEVVIGDGKNGFYAVECHGVVVKRGAFIEGKRTGIWLEVSADGSRCEAEYHEGRKHGREAMWNADGRLRYTGEWRDGREQGLWTSHHADGVLFATREYDAGRLSGEMRTYHANGQLKEVSVYAGGRDVAATRGWRDDGSIEFEMPYVEGVRQGRALWYHGNGVVSARGDYADGQLGGEYVTFDETGGEVSVELWESGTRTAGPASRETIAAGGARVPKDEGAKR